MRTITGLLLIIGMLFMSMPLYSQQKPQKTQKEMTDEALRQPALAYNPAGRRDPFRDLLVGQELKETAQLTGIHQISIDDIFLAGIVKARGKLVAVINGPQGFSYHISEGDKFSDGYVISITDSKVVFRKTKDRGIPLFRPRNITKEINPEEQ